MRSIGSYLLLMFMVMFWVFRIVVAVCATLGFDIGFLPLNTNIEIILLFVTFICVILVGKRKLLGGILYLVSYGLYFGVDLYHIVMNLINEADQMIDYTNAGASFIAICIAFGVFFSLLIDKNRKDHPVDKKTDWFYQNEEFDRKLDERADRNNYRNY